MTTDPTTLTQHDGKPVPWITRWTGEVVQEPYGIQRTPTGVLVGYPDGNENREASGLLWQREGLNRSGVPMWADVNTYRQRACIARCKCQVCGAAIDGRPIPWLMPTAEYNMLEEDGTLRTTTAPICRECVPLALELCPGLPKMGWTLLHVAEYEVWGAFAEVVLIQDEQVRRIPPMDVAYSGPPQVLRQAVARQQIARLTKFVAAERGGGKA